MDQTEISAQFRRKALFCILSILLFIVTYLTLLVAAIALTLALAFGAVWILKLMLNGFSIAIAAGMVFTGLIVFGYLVKFVFKKYKVDKTGWTQVFPHGEPELFELIREIADAVDTPMPKKVFFASDVNAFVFYDSTFWSLFLPVRKNLCIGLGLLHCISKDELRAILAHEFGHFSQKSMRIGSYVYYVNQILHNLLYENQGFNYSDAGDSSISNIFIFFNNLGIKIIEGIQQILRLVYKVVNQQHLALSREMEFHADAVAAHKVGPQYLASSLLRLPLAQHALSVVCNYYDNRQQENLRTRDIYSQQKWVMDFFARRSRLPFKGELPLADLRHLSRFNASKLNFADQWSSHPTLEQRLNALSAADKAAESGAADEPAIRIIRNADDWDQKMTDLLFSGIQFPGIPANLDIQAFANDFMAKFEGIAFPTFFNGYYDDRNPEFTETVNASEDPENALKACFSDEMADLACKMQGLIGDINTLTQIAGADTEIRSFEYDGGKYHIDDISELIQTLKDELENVRGQLRRNDALAFANFAAIAEKQGKIEQFEAARRHFETMDAQYEPLFQVGLAVYEAAQFMEQNNAFGTIEHKQKQLAKLEAPLKEKIAWIMESPDYQTYITEQLREAFQQYCAQEWLYFTRPKYDNDAIGRLVAAVHGYRELLMDSYYQSKKKLLQTAAALLPAA